MAEPETKEKVGPSAGEEFAQSKSDAIDLGLVCDAVGFGQEAPAWARNLLRYVAASSKELRERIDAAKKSKLLALEALTASIQGLYQRVSALEKKTVPPESAGLTSGAEKELKRPLTKEEAHELLQSIGGLGKALNRQIGILEAKIEELLVCSLKSSGSR